MTIETFKVLEEKIKSDCREKLDSLYEQYAEENKKYKIGDILEDKFSKEIILVNKLKWGYSYNTTFPSEIIYYGEVLTKKLEPKKNKSYSSIYEHRAIAVKVRQNA